MNYKVLMAALLIATIARAQDEELDPVPPGWGMMGNGGHQALRGRCEMGVDGAMLDVGQPNLTIRCNNDIPSFGGLTETFLAGDYFGKRVRFSAWLQAWDISDIDGIEGGGGLFVTVPTINGPLMSRMEERKLRGSTNWEYHDFVVDIPAYRDIVVDIPEEVVPIVIGFWMQGQGQIWIRDIEFEEVPASVPVNLSAETDEAPGPVPIR